MLPNISSIPDWDSFGIIPASIYGEPNSPYEVSLPDIVAQFGSTESRQSLLMGLLNFRAELHSAGLVQGFQWIDGSFMENVEERENRNPRDIDLVTFFYIPDHHTQESLVQEFSSIFDHDEVKDIYAVDSYFVPLNQVSPETIVNRSVYWHSLWSHNRDSRRKGYLQVDLASIQDSGARTELDRLIKEGEAP